MSVAAPDSDGVRRRDFSTEAAAKSFTDLFEVVVASLTTVAASPSLFRMLLRFLELVDKVYNTCCVELLRLVSHGCLRRASHSQLSCTSSKGSLSASASASRAPC